MVRNGRSLWILMVLLWGCSPALNWRELRLGTAPLRMLLPCKPDRAEREVTMAGQKFPLQMQGCDADGATFAVSHVWMPDAAQADVVLAGWKTAVLTHVRAGQVPGQPWAPTGASASPQSLRVQVDGQQANGAAVVLHGVWFSVVDGAGAHLFHAAVFAPRPRLEAADTFFSSLTVAP